MSSRRGGEMYSVTGASNPSVKGKISTEGSSSEIDQLCQGVEGVSMAAGQDNGWEVFSRKSKNKAGNSRGKQFVPHSTTSKAWGDPATRQKLGMQSNIGSGKGTGNARQEMQSNFDSKRVGGRGNAKPQLLNLGNDNSNTASSLVIQPPLGNGWDWNKRASSSQSSHNQGSKNNVEIVNTENDEDVKIDEVDDDSDSDVLDDSDDELLSDDSDSGAIGKSHETYKKDRWFKELFDCIDSLTVEQIHEPERQWHCPACKGGPGAIDWYGLQPLITHAKTKGSKRVKLHRKLAQLLEEELRIRGTSVIPAGEIFGVWRGLDVRVEKEIVWPPMVIIMNTRHDKDEKGQWIGMGNQELLDYFSNYDAVKSRQSYGPQGHRGIGVLIFEASAIGYLEAERLSKHFEDNGRDKTAWESGRPTFYLGGQRQLYGHMAEKRDLEYFNQHSTGKVKLNFEMRSYQEMVVKQLKQMREDNQQLIIFKDKVAKEQKHSKAIEEAYGLVSERYRKTLEENRILRQRTKMYHEQNKEEMDSQENFFKDQLKIMYDARKAKEENFEKIQQEEQETVKQSHGNPCSVEDHKHSDATELDSSVWTSQPTPDLNTTQTEEHAIDIPAQVEDSTILNEDQGHETAAIWSDDSSDEEYSPSELGEMSDDSDTPSWMYEGLEGPDDDNIFIQDSRSCKAKYLLMQKRLRMMFGRSSERKDKQIEHDESSEAEEEEGMHMLDQPTSDNGVQIPTFPVFNPKTNMKEFNMEVGMKFRSKEEFKEVLKDWSIRKHWEMKIVKNDKTRVTAICKTCGNFRIHASRIQGGETWQLKTLKSEGKHTCYVQDNKMANYKYLGKRLEKVIRAHPNDTIKNMKDSLQHKVKINVSKYKTIRAKKVAVTTIQGDWAEQYHKLKDYAKTVVAYNPGTTIIMWPNMEIQNEHVFDRMFYCLASLKNGFLAGCRPLIGLDGCFLKSVYGGQLLTAVARDGNDNIFPIAWAVVSIEKKETWKWFLERLHNVIGHPYDKGWCYISDRQKGLLEVFKEDYPEVHHRYCLRHMYSNFKLKFSGLKMKDLLWQTASTANINEFERCMKKIAEADPKVQGKENAFEWLSKIPPEHWARSHFPTDSKCDVLVNNLCESFNSYIIDSRDKPAITMNETMRMQLMTRVRIKRETMETYELEVCPNIMRKLRRMNSNAMGWYAKWSGNDGYEVIQDWTKHVVNLGNLTKSCTCGMFELTGYPCVHALACINQHGKRLEDYVHPCYKKEMYLQAYQFMINPVPGPDDYLKSNEEPFKPPIIPKKTGRPPKVRRRGPDEVRAQGRTRHPLSEQVRQVSTRRGLTITCSRCLQIGHNRSRCKANVENSTANAPHSPPPPSPSPHPVATVQARTPPHTRQSIRRVSPNQIGVPSSSRGVAVPEFPRPPAARRLIGAQTVAMPPFTARPHAPPTIRLPIPPTPRPPAPTTARPPSAPTVRPHAATNASSGEGPSKVVGAKKRKMSEPQVLQRIRERKRSSKP